MIRPLPRFLPALLRIAAFVVAVAAALMPLGVQAQQQGGGEGGPPLVSVTCYVLSLGVPVTGVHVPGMGGRSSLTVPNAAPSSAIRYRGPQLMRFYSGDAAPVASAQGAADSASGSAAAASSSDGAGDGSAVRQVPQGSLPFAEVLLPAGADAVLLLFVPTAAGEPPRVAAMPINESQFTDGSLLFQNFTTESVAVNIGSQTFALEPMRSHVFRQGANNDVSNGIVRMARLTRDEGAELFYQSRWSFLPGRRIWVFFLPGNADGEVVIRRYYDVLGRGA